MQSTRLFMMVVSQHRSCSESNDQTSKSGCQRD